MSRKRQYLIGGSERSKGPQDKRQSTGPLDVSGFIDLASFSEEHAKCWNAFRDKFAPYLTKFNCIGGVFRTIAEGRGMLIRPVGTFEDKIGSVYLIRDVEVSRKRVSSLKSILTDLSLQSKLFAEEVIATFDPGISDASSVATISRMQLLLRRPFVSSTGSELLRANQGIRLSRIINGIYTFLSQLSILHKNGGYHGSIRMGNISFGVESLGQPLDYMLIDRKDIDKAQKDDLKFLASLIHTFISKAKLQATDEADREILLLTLAPLFAALGDSDLDRIPTIATVMGLFEELCAEFLKPPPTRVVITEALDASSDLKAEVEVSASIQELLEKRYENQKSPERGRSLASKQNIKKEILVQEKPDLQGEEGFDNFLIEGSRSDVGFENTSDLPRNKIVEPALFENDLKVSEVRNSQFENQEKSTLLFDKDRELDNDNEELDLNNQDSRKKTGGRNILLLVLIILGLALCYKVSLRISSFVSGFMEESEVVFTGPYLSSEELQSAWSSKIPSRVKLVAKQAVFSSPARGLAEEIILAELNQNTQNSSALVDESILRVAFSREWEEQLSVDDRRYALSAALREILKNDVPRDLGLIQDRHPGVILALTGAASLTSEGAGNAVLNSVPASILESLPEPYGVAFRILNSGATQATCGSREVIEFAKLATRGVQDAHMLSQFLNSGFNRKLASLAVVFSRNVEASAKVLDIVIDHPNYSVSNADVNWAKKVSLTQWQDLDGSDKLFLLAGVPLKSDRILSEDNVARLFLSPSARVRSFAAGKAINLIPFKHKGASEILNIVEKNPAVVSADQLVMLGQILEDPERTVEAHMKVVQAFIASKPPLEIARILLISGGDQRIPSILDSALSVYLTELGWEPDVSDLSKLVLHRDQVARMFSYQKTFELKDVEVGASMLKEALRRETVPELRVQLEGMISKLGSR